ncbi:hypothetical protein EDC01DRAFT_666330, partial [Geopyxis carbonaria]
MRRTAGPDDGSDADCHPVLRFLTEPDRARSRQWCENRYLRRHLVCTFGACVGSSLRILLGWDVDARSLSTAPSRRAVHPRPAGRGMTIAMLFTCTYHTTQISGRSFNSTIVSLPAPFSLLRRRRPVSYWVRLALLLPILSLRRCVFFTEGALLRLFITGRRSHELLYLLIPICSHGCLLSSMMEARFAFFIISNRSLLRLLSLTAFIALLKLLHNFWLSRPVLAVSSSTTVQTGEGSVSSTQEEEENV